MVSQLIRLLVLPLCILYHENNIVIYMSIMCCILRNKALPKAITFYDGITMTQLTVGDDI